MKRWLLFVVLAAMLVSPTALALAAPQTDGVVYVVQKGDTLAAIALRYGVTVDTLVKANNLANANRIYVGQRLVIPSASGGGATGGSTGSGTATCTSPYVVQKGDTLGRIASKCGVSASAIVTANQLKNINLIYVGQKLVIPNAPASGASPTATPAPGNTPAPTAVPSSGAPALSNPSFEGSWTTDAQGNQHPTGWNFVTWPVNATLPYPTKGQQGNTVAAISNGPGEYIHKLSWQLPAEEQPGKARALILDGSAVYKVFGAAGPHALQLSQTLTGQPGTTLRVTVYILGETWDKPTSPTGRLEDDHFVAGVTLGGTEDRRTYASMKGHQDVAGNQRAWNKFLVQAVVPASGQLPLTLTFQQNWWGRTDFFVDALSVEVVH